MGLELPSFGLSEEQLEFRSMLRRFLADRLPMAAVREDIESETGLALDVWRESCQTLGLAGLAVTEEAGGQGFGLHELAIGLGEVGRGLCPLPLLSIAGLVVPAIAAVTHAEGSRARLRRIIPGDELPSLAWVEPGGDWSPAATRTVVDGSGRISGEKAFVLHADAATMFYVVARVPDKTGAEGLKLVAVDARTAGVEVEPVETLDLTQRMARVRFEGAVGDVVSTRDDVGKGLESVLETASVLLCAQAVGAMERVLESAVDFAKSRRQFGRPIGSFQAIKHKAADMLIDFECARTATWAAIDARESDDAEAGVLAAVAKAFTGPAFVRMSTENLQIHGGVGYTWEYDAHLYFRRAHFAALFLGDATSRHEAIALDLADRLDGLGAL